MFLFTFFYFRRLAKSTLVLIPIFGVYYIMFTFPMDKLGDTASFVMLFIEMFFNSYQVSRKEHMFYLSSICES